jgi:hypothetical protein
MTAAAANHRQRYFRSRRTAEQARTFEHRHVAGRLAVDAPHEVAGLQPGLGRGGAVARGNHPQVVLASQLQADVAIRQRLAAAHRLDLLGVEIRRIRIESVGEALQRAFHRAVDLHVLDVVRHHQLHDIVEHAQVAEGSIARRALLADEAADDHERQDWRRDEQDRKSGLRSHGGSAARTEVQRCFFSHCKGSTAVPSTRNSKYSAGLPAGFRPPVPTAAWASRRWPRLTPRAPR